MHPTLRLLLLVVCVLPCVFAQLTVPLSSSMNVTGISDHNVRAFLGIPFAKPPVGELRWQQPQLINYSQTFNYSNIDATKFGAKCIQFNDGQLEGSEDCLTLNIWTPVIVSQPLPVLVYIFGGGFAVGTSTKLQGYNMVEASGGKMIVVSINYRLGAMGFLALRALSNERTPVQTSGMLGIEDQQAALRWVHENIAAFGGDNTKVTIMGESAGSISVCLHLLSPMSANLFSAAILNSGGCDDELKGLDAAEAAGQLFTNKLAEVAAKTNNFAPWQINALNSSSDPITQAATLRSMPADLIINASIANNGYFFFGPTAFQPCGDGYIIPGWPKSLFESGSYNRVPLLLGSNAFEMGIFIFPGSEMFTMNVSDPAVVQDLIYKASDGNSTVVNFYSQANNPGQSQSLLLTRALGALFFQCTQRRLARYSSMYQQPVYLYNFRYAGDHNVFKAYFGFSEAVHSSELPYVFGIPHLTFNNLGQSINKTLYGEGFTTDNDAAISVALMTYWMRFVISRNPNDQSITMDPNVMKRLNFKNTTARYQPPQWDQFNPQVDNILTINNNLTFLNAYSYLNDECNIWDGDLTYFYIYPRYAPSGSSSGGSYPMSSSGSSYPTSSTGSSSDSFCSMMYNDCRTCLQYPQCGFCSYTSGGGSCVSGNYTGSQYCPDASYQKYIPYMSPCPCNSLYGCESCTSNSQCGFCSDAYSCKPVNYTTGQPADGQMCSAGSWKWGNGMTSVCNLFSSTGGSTYGGSSGSNAPASCSSYYMDCAGCLSNPNCGFCDLPGSYIGCMDVVNNAPNPQCAAQNGSWHGYLTQCPCSSFYGCSTCNQHYYCGFCTDNYLCLPVNYTNPNFKSSSCSAAAWVYGNGAPNVCWGSSSGSYDSTGSQTSSSGSYTPSGPQGSSSGSYESTGSAWSSTGSYPAYDYCMYQSRCDQCGQGNCGWCSASNTCMSGTLNGTMSCASNQWVWDLQTCPVPKQETCSNFYGCYNCISSSYTCGWDDVAQQCVPGTPQGPLNVSANFNNKTWGWYDCPTPYYDPCSMLYDCNSCLSTPGCGYCWNNNMNYGNCHSGNSTGPIGQATCDSMNQQSWIYSTNTTLAVKSCPCQTLYNCTLCSARNDCGWCSAPMYGDRCLPAVAKNSFETCNSTGATFTYPLSINNCTANQYSYSSSGSAGASCSSIFDCAQCLQNSACGWLNSPGGYGSCYPANATRSGPDCYMCMQYDAKWFYGEQSTKQCPCSSLRSCTTCSSNPSCGYCSQNYACVANTTDWCPEPLHIGEWSCPIDSSSSGPGPAWSSSGSSGYADPCNEFSCTQCTQQKECGWCPSSYSCIGGNSQGALNAELYPYCRGDPSRWVFGPAAICPARSLWNCADCVSTGYGWCEQPWFGSSCSLGSMIGPQNPHQCRPHLWIWGKNNSAACPVWSSSSTGAAGPATSSSTGAASSTGSSAGNITSSTGGATSQSSSTGAAAGNTTGSTGAAAFSSSTGAAAASSSTGSAAGGNTTSSTGAASSTGSSAGNTTSSTGGTTSQSSSTGAAAGNTTSSTGATSSTGSSAGNTTSSTGGATSQSSSTGGAAGNTTSSSGAASSTGSSAGNTTSSTGGATSKSSSTGAAAGNTTSSSTGSSTGNTTSSTGGATSKSSSTGAAGGNTTSSTGSSTAKSSSTGAAAASSSASPASPSSSASVVVSSSAAPFATSDLSTADMISSAAGGDTADMSSTGDASASTGPAAPPTVTAVQVQMKLNIDIAQVDDQKKSELSSSFCTSIQLDPSRCEVASVSAGSILVNFNILPDPNNSSAPTPQEALVTVNQQFNNPNSPLLTNSALQVDPTYTPTTTTVILVLCSDGSYRQSCPSSSDGLSTGAIIGIAVGCSVGGLILIGVIVYMLSSRSSHTSHINELSSRSSDRVEKFSTKEVGMTDIHDIHVNVEEQTHTSTRVSIV